MRHFQFCDTVSERERRFERHAEVTRDVCNTSLRLLGFFFSRSYRTNTEGLRSITEQDQRAGPHIGKLIIVFSGEENDFVFLHNPLLSIDRLNGALAVDNEKCFRRLVIVHGSAVTRLEVKEPRAKVVGSEKRGVSDGLLVRLVDFLLQVYEFH